MKTNQPSFTHLAMLIVFMIPVLPHVTECAQELAFLRPPFTIAYPSQLHLSYH